MQFLASKLTGRWIIDRGHARPIGQVAQLIMDVPNLKLLYYGLTTANSTSSPFVRADQASLEESVLTVASEAALGTPEDFLRDEALLRKPINLVGFRVIDRAKHSLGRVSDYSISTPGLHVERLMISPPFWQKIFATDRIVARSAVYEVQANKRLIILKQNQGSLRARGSERVPTPQSAAM